MQTEKQRERLVELLKNADTDKNLGWYDLYDLCLEEGGCAEYFADYLMSNNVVVLPCKIGDKAFQIDKNCLDCPHYTDGGYSDWCECVLDDNKMMFEVDFDKDCIYEIIETKFAYAMIGEFGKTVFLSRSEAENVLKERKEK